MKTVDFCWRFHWNNDGYITDAYMRKIMHYGALIKTPKILTWYIENHLVTKDYPVIEVAQLYV